MYERYTIHEDEWELTGTIIEWLEVCQRFQIFPC